MKIDQTNAPYIIIPVEEFNNIKRKAEESGYDKAVQTLRSSDAFYYWTAQKDYLNNMQWAYWLDIKKGDNIK